MKSIVIGLLLGVYQAHDLRVSNQDLVFIQQMLVPQNPTTYDVDDELVMDIIQD